MNIKKFEDLNVWEESRKLVNMIYNLTSKPSFSKDFGLKEQIQRAAVSCMSNVAEGFDSDTNQQFIQMLTYTTRSASEVQSQLYVALDRNLISNEEFKEAYQESGTVRKLASGLIRYLRGKTPTNPATRLTDKPANRQTQP